MISPKQASPLLVDSQRFFSSSYFLLLFWLFVCLSQCCWWAWIIRVATFSVFVCYFVLLFSLILFATMLLVMTRWKTPQIRSKQGSPCCFFFFVFVCCFLFVCLFVCLFFVFLFLFVTMLLMMMDRCKKTPLIRSKQGSPPLVDSPRPPTQSSNYWDNICTFWHGYIKYKHKYNKWKHKYKNKNTTNANTNTIDTTMNQRWKKCKK